MIRSIYAHGCTVVCYTIQVMNKSKGFSLSSLVKVLILLFIFGIFPLFVAVVSLNYKDKADSLIESQNPTADGIAIDSTGGSIGGMKVLTEEQAGTLKKARSFLLGRWVSLQDGGYTVDFLANNNFIDKDNGQVVAYGTWGSFISATSSSKIGVSTSDTAYYLEKTHAEDKYKDQKFIYEIMQLDQDRAILFYTGNSKILYFNKATSTTP